MTVMTGKKRVSGSNCCMCKSSIIRGSGIAFFGSLGPLRNEELLREYHQPLVFGHSRKPPEYGRVFSRTVSKKFLRLYTDYERRVKQSNKEEKVKRIFSLSQLLLKPFARVY